MLSDRFYARLSMSLGATGLRVLGKLNVPVYRLTRGRLLGSVGRAPVLLLTTTGRRSGAERTAPLVYVPDGERIVVIGSNAGNAKTPAWSLNLRANPHAQVEVDGRRMRVRARVAQGEERETLWRKANALYAGFEDYEARTSRSIFVFVLEPLADTADASSTADFDGGSLAPRLPA
ncbi:MAG: nitroreductase/quinone reductase family protein [Solirubrobacteraceae bacterium]